MIAAWNGVDALSRCLASIRASAACADAEVIVARNFDGGAGAMIARDFPSALDLPLDPATTVPLLRGAGLSRANGDVVALLEDHCAVGPTWCAAVLRAHRAGQVAVGGPVDHAEGGRGLDWAVYLYDYGRYAPPGRGGPTDQLSGINGSYSRAVLTEVADFLRDGVREDTFQRELLGRGHSLFLEPEAVVVLGKRHTARPAVGQAYHLARGFAGRRVADSGVPARLARALGTIALPVLLLGRILGWSRGKPRLRRALPAAFPWLVILVTAWSVGEMVGYLSGEGVSATRWR